EGEQDVKGVLSVITANVARKKEKKLKAEREDKNQPDSADKDNKETKEEPAAAASKSGADEVILLDSSDSTTSTKSDEDESGEEQEPEELGTAYESATARCGRKCCLLILVLFLTGLVVANVAFTLTPRRFSNFLCSLGIFKPDNLGSLNESVTNDESHLLRPLEGSTSGKSIFDVNHVATERDLFDEEHTDQIDEDDDSFGEVADNMTSGCNASIPCNQTVVDANTMLTSTEDTLQKFLRLEYVDSAADDIVEDDDSLRSIDFGSFLDTGAVERRSTMSTTSVFLLQSERESAFGKLPRTPSALKDLLAHIPQTFSKPFSAELQTPKQGGGL
ncbi:hypothetical protein MRX96_046350, partial [Rhipicephalus microplus]